MMAASLDPPAAAPAVPATAHPGAPAAATAPPPYIRLAGVGKTYRGAESRVQALVDIDLDVHEREFVSIVGPSGCGKSTLMMMVAGLYRPSRGRITGGSTRANSPAACASGRRSAARSCTTRRCC